MRADRKDIFKSRFQEHYSRLCRIAYGYVSDQDDAEDIVQELFISVWNKRLDDMPEKEFAAYMTTSVRNSCVSFLRKRKEDTVSIDVHPASASCMPDETPEEGKTLQDILDSALETLPPRCKDVFLLAKLQGLKYREIAEKLEVGTDDSVLIFEQAPIMEVVKVIREKTGIQIDLAEGLEKNLITTRINSNEPDIAGELAFLCGCKCETLVKGKHYHFLRFDSFSLPTDFRMPSIDGFKPRSSEHYEMGWKHFMNSGQCEVSVYYKTRRNVLALCPDTWVEDEGWQKYLMVGDGDSYGVKGYLYQRWKRWSLQLSYAYSRSLEWFGELPEKGKVPSLYDVPHQLGGALSYQLTTHSSFSAGGMLRSGKVRFLNEDYEPLSVEEFREKREPLNYRVDVGYSYRKSFGEKLLLLRLGVYNVVGNPSEEDILSFYSVHWSGNCLPYGSLSFKF